jgi:transcriptional regulator with XRE-family HTH domain
VKLDENRVRGRRERLGLTLAMLAQKAGTSKNTLLSAEHGGDIRPTTASKIAEALDVEIGDLLGEPTYPKAPEQLSFEWTLSVTDTDMLRAALRDVPTERLRNWIKALAGNQRVKTVEDLRTREGIDEARAQSLVMHRATEIRAELLRRNDEDPKDYLPDLAKYLNALDLP